MSTTVTYLNLLYNSCPHLRLESQLHTSNCRRHQCWYRCDRNHGFPAHTHRCLLNSTINGCMMYTILLNVFEEIRISGTRESRDCQFCDCHTFQCISSLRVHTLYLQINRWNLNLAIKIWKLAPQRAMQDKVWTSRVPQHKLISIEHVTKSDLSPPIYLDHNSRVPCAIWNIQRILCTFNQVVEIHIKET